MLRQFDSQLLTALELRAALAVAGPKHADKSLSQALNAGEFITTRKSHLSRRLATTLPPSAANLSPAPQEFGPNGELMRREMAPRETSHGLTTWSQMLEQLAIVTNRQTAREANLRQHSVEFITTRPKDPVKKSEPMRVKLLSRPESVSGYLLNAPRGFTTGRLRMD